MKFDILDLESRIKSFINVGIDLPDESDFVFYFSKKN
jgi:hypothetical protein